MERSTTDTSEPVDPLAECYSFSLFPLSFNRSPLDDPNPNFDIHSHLKAMALRSPNKLLKQAKTILDDSMELLKTDKTSATATNKSNKVSSMNDKNPQEKRPALGLKRAKFSVKPMPSQPDAVSEPTLDIGKLKDPVEFFAAYEKMENTKKEMQRLKGQPLVNLDQNLSALSPRRRRPSIFGKSATYKHHSYSSTVVDENVEISLSSQKTSGKHIASSNYQDPLSEIDVVNNSQPTKVSGSTRVMASEENELDELLSRDFEGLDESGLLDILQEKLQIKLKDVDKTALPEFLDVHRRESETCDTLPKMKDAITRLHGIRKTSGSQRPSLSAQLKESSVRSQVTPVQHKSPLASMSLLNRHIAKISPPKDPFSAVDIDSPPIRIPSPETVHVRQSDKLDTREDLYESGTSLMRGEENGAAANNPPVQLKNITAQSSGLQELVDVVGQYDQDGAGKDMQKCDTSAARGEETTALSSVSSPSSEEKDISSTIEPKECTDGAAQSCQVVEEVDLCDLRRSPAHGEHSVANGGEDLPLLDARGIDSSSEPMEQENEVNAARDSLRLEEFSVHGVEECTIGEVLNTDDIDMEEPNKNAAEPSKKKMETSRKSKAASKTSKKTVKKGEKANAQTEAPISEETTKRKRKAEEAPLASKREKLNRRNSLYAAGTKWDAGLRRSTRIKMRPLEFWRGERFLYGRVHNSLVTVIGVKYASPGKEVVEKPPVKVKSFVSDEYKELVDLAALH